MTVTQKVTKPVRPEKAAKIISDLSQWRLCVIDVDDILRAIDIQQHNKLSFWDSLIICSAIRLNCAVLLTEDLCNGRTYEGIKALNPFAR